LCENDDQAAYLEWLKSEFDHPLLTIRKFSDLPSPSEAFTQAVNLRRSEKTKGTHFDEVWCVLTLPTVDDVVEALSMPRPTGVHLAVTAGDFAIWLRLHWEETEQLPLVLIEETSPSGFAAALAGRVGIALRRASQRSGVTTVDELVRALDASGKAFRGRENDSNPELPIFRSEDSQGAK
jgi:hypothetical protein